MRWLPAFVALLAGCAAVELEAEEPVYIHPCDDPANQGTGPRDDAEAASWREAGEAMVAHGAVLGEIFDRTCPELDVICLGALDTELAPHAERTRELGDEMFRLSRETCDRFSEFYALDTPATPDGDNLITLLRMGGYGTERINEARDFIAGVSRTISGCYTLEPID
jgi:hypothetical protein